MLISKAWRYFYTKAQFVPLVDITVKDHDMIRNDQIGHVAVDLKKCFENPGKVVVNIRQVCL